MSLLATYVRVVEAWAYGIGRFAMLLLFALMAVLLYGVIGRAGSAPPIARLVNRLHHRRRANTKRGSRRNIAYHYDLGNAFYERWLDPSMTYSAARFESDGQDLESAQTAKYRLLAESLRIAPGDPRQAERLAVGFMQPLDVDLLHRAATRRSAGAGRRRPRRRSWRRAARGR